jgi:hypothetical protein
MTEPSNHPKLFTAVDNLFVGQPRAAVLSVLLNCLTWQIIQDSSDVAEAEAKAEDARRHLVEMIRLNWGVKP